MLHAVISGKVQGVFFRASIKDLADKLKLKGYARNLSNGSVEVKASGSEEAVYTMLDFLRKGPPGALVKKINYSFLEDEEFSCFFID